MWVYVSSLPVIPKQPHKPTWAEVVGHHLYIIWVPVLFHGRTSLSLPSLELMCFLPSLPPFLPSLPPCPSLFLQLFAAVVVVFPTAKKKKEKMPLGEPKSTLAGSLFVVQVCGEPSSVSSPQQLACSNLLNMKGLNRKRKPSTPFCSIHESKRRLLGSRHS